MHPILALIGVVILAWLIATIGAWVLIAAAILITVIAVITIVSEVLINEEE